MTPLALQAPPQAEPNPLIEGYASLFGVTDQAGDQVRAGAFAEALLRAPVPMLLQHTPGAIAGRWTRLIEDGRGLYVRGLVETPSAQQLIQDGLNGLSIGFRPQVWMPRAEGGRTLIKLDLVEISLVAEPMLAGARFQVMSGYDK
ncbi:MAG: HK97 family phage prohead protease [Pseudomonadota bacterium]